MKRVLLLSGLLMFLFSCEKDDKTKPKGQAINCKIIQEFTYQEGEPNYGDLTDYIYDENDRLIKLYYSNMSGQTYDSTSFFYDNKGRLKYQLSAPGTDTSNIYFYDNFDRIIKNVSMSGDTIDAEIHYYYSGVSKLAYASFNDFKHSENERYSFKWANKNLIEITLTEIGGTVLQKTDPVKIQYDNKINPYLFIGYSGSSLFGQTISSNNLTKITLETDSTTFESSLNYEYNQYNYPVKIIDNSTSDSITLITEIKYECEEINP